MKTTEVKFTCQTELWNSFRAVYVRQSEDATEVLMDIIRSSVQSRLKENELAQIRSAVSSALSVAWDWGSMQFELEKFDLAYLPAARGLVIFRISTGEIISMAARVGPTYTQLVKLFREGFPNHPRPWLAEETLAKLVPVDENFSTEGYRRTASK